jgi:3-phosphoshikimate 1-carboxyvinyltransferase
MKRVLPSSVNGSVQIPASKSFTQRALACALISNGESFLKNIGISDDEQASAEIIRKAGATINRIENDVIIQSSGFNPSGELNFNVNESGLATRMFTPILANSTFKVNITGQGSILGRTMSFFDEILPQLTIQFNSNQGKLPFSFRGPIQPKTINVDGSISSQYITGLIYSYVASPLLRNEKINIHNVKSEPYLLLTLDVLKLFGVDLIYKDKTVHFDGPYILKPTSISIEGDWSSASFLLVAGAIAGKVSLSGLNTNSKQADIAILDVLKKAGAKVEQQGDSLMISKNELNGFEFDATDCPDLFPPIAVLAGLCKGSSKIKGANRLIHKESNRGIVLQKELKQFGIEITLEDDLMIISPTEKVIEGTIDPHGDHRIAMAGAILGLVSQKGINILTPHVVNKSFPQFYNILEELTSETNIKT